MEVNHVTCSVSEDNITIYNEIFQDQLSTMYQDRSGYLYTCETSGNITLAHTTGIWSAKEPVTVMAAEYIGDVYDLIMQEEAAGNVQIIRYESLSEKKKLENTEIIKNYILKNNLLSTDSAKSRFWAKYYSQAWKIAEMEKADNKGY